ncbi:DUF2971 domain-containing protein [Planococcus sp. YIM B11945]|uniref:DUF2971 domain-containing protein n=1 Tax=Planococcus sp. YIM B11945 TaxID=3435410 RepID=UPI003D7EFFD6
MENNIRLAEALEQQFRNNVGKKVQKAHATEQILYHYTALPSLMGMVESNRLWMSKGTFLNDSSELVYFSRVLAHIIKKMDNHQNSPLWRLFIRELERVMELFIEEVQKSGFEAYIFSLSHTQDSLALWYNYARGEGYNIGFSAEELFANVSLLSDGPDVLHGYVMYERLEQEAVLIELLLEAYELVDRYEIGEVKTALADHFFSMIATCSVFFKDPAFKSEEEYRIALLTRKGEKPKVQFRAQNGVIIPYIAIDFQSKLPIKHVTIGPKNNVDIAKSGMEHYLKWKGYDMEKVTISKSVAALRY